MTPDRNWTYADFNDWASRNWTRRLTDPFIEDRWRAEFIGVNDPELWWLLGDVLGTYPTRKDQKRFFAACGRLSEATGHTFIKAVDDFTNDVLETATGRDLKAVTKALRQHIDRYQRSAT